MNRRVVTLSLAVLGAGFGAAYLWRQLDELHDRKVELQARVLALESAQHVVASAGSPRQVATAPASAAQASVATDAAPSPPDFQPTRAARRASLVETYGPDLAPELGMTPEELEHFLDLLVNLQISQGQEGSREKATADRAAIAALLGSRAATWREYQRTLADRQQVNQLRADLAASGLTLPAEQGRTLITTLNAERTAYIKEWIKIRGPAGATARERMEQSMQYMLQANRRLIEAARPLLTAPQFEVYKRMLDQQTEFTRYSLLGRDAPQEGASSGN